MASGPGTYHHKLLRELLLKYFADGNSVESAVVFFEFVKELFDLGRLRRWMARLRMVRLARKVQSWTIMPEHFEYLLHYLETRDSRLFQMVCEMVLFLFVYFFLIQCLFQKCAIFFFRISMLRILSSKFIVDLLISMEDEEES